MCLSKAARSDILWWIDNVHFEVRDIDHNRFAYCLIPQTLPNKHRRGQYLQFCVVRLTTLIQEVDGQQTSLLSTLMCLNLKQDSWD